MKHNLEEIFRKSLQNHEEPYNPAAWEAVKAQLKPVTTPNNGTGTSKWLWIAVAGVVALPIVGYFAFKSNDVENVNVAKVEETKKEVALNNEKITGVKINPEITIDTVVESKELTKAIETNSIADNNSLSMERNNEVNVVNTDDEFGSLTVSHNNETDNSHSTSEDENIRQAKVPTVESTHSASFTKGVISSSSVCEGDEVVISNPDSSGKLVKFIIDGEVIVLKSETYQIVYPNTSLEIKFVDNDGNEIASNFVRVTEKPSANFSYESNIYEKGLPIIQGKAYGDNLSYVWSLNDKEIGKGQQLEYNIYEKGRYSLKLTAKDNNGCESTTEKIVHIQEKYNLMAVDAFKPNGVDSRNKTFMPYSLTQRDVKFKLTIVDPNDNSVVFTSESAENAWDGIDQRTGKMTPSEKAYVWKVQIMNPEINERPVYMGTIVHN